METNKDVIVVVEQELPETPQLIKFISANEVEGFDSIQNATSSLRVEGSHSPIVSSTLITTQIFHCRIVCTDFDLWINATKKAGNRNSEGRGNRGERTEQTPGSFHKHAIISDPQHQKSGVRRRGGGKRRPASRKRAKGGEIFLAADPSEAQFRAEPRWASKAHRPAVRLLQDVVGEAGETDHPLARKAGQRARPRGHRAHELRGDREQPTAPPLLRRPRRPRIRHP